MTKVISFLMLALVLLGFLGAITIIMHGDMEQLKVENQKLSRELSQLRSNYQTIVRERDEARTENASLNAQFNTLQTAYLAENQARLKAESDVATYKSMVINMAKNVQTVPSAACLPAEQQAVKPEELLLSNIAPISASSLITLAVAIVVVSMINHSRRQKKLKTLPTRLKNFP